MPRKSKKSRQPKTRFAVEPPAAPAPAELTRAQIQSVACPKCGAKAGVGGGCVGPTGKALGRYHSERIGVAELELAGKPGTNAFGEPVSPKLDAALAEAVARTAVEGKTLVRVEDGEPVFEEDVDSLEGALDHSERTNAGDAPAGAPVTPRERILGRLGSLEAELGALEDELERKGLEDTASEIACAVGRLGVARSQVTALPKNWLPVGSKVRLLAAFADDYRDALGSGPLLVEEIRGRLARFGEGSGAVFVPVRFLTPA